MDVEVATVEHPQWMKALMEVVIECMEPLNIMGPLGYRFLEPEHPENEFEGWQIAVYPTANEVVGGEQDGSFLFPGFALDIDTMLATFSSVEGVVWNNPVHYTGDLDGPNLSIQGTFTGVPLWLRIFHWPPGDEEASLLVDPASGEIREKSRSVSG